MKMRRRKNHNAQRRWFAYQYWTPIYLRPWYTDMALQKDYVQQGHIYRGEYGTYYG